MLLLNPVETWLSWASVAEGKKVKLSLYLTMYYAMKTYGGVDI
jgi:hypothetical protein